ncbi:fatty-acid amide hydrolase 2-like [Calliopsis andreniformis]|uniref:fatty-acid amide hydrolase 2-like n=1 Tax=Calliopsis andreniformis TaxID=337506 RepID=UPI003FCE9EAC
MILAHVIMQCMHLMHFILRHIYDLIYRKKFVPILPIEFSILKLSATTLAKKIRLREISCEKVVEAYIDRIREINFYIYAVVEDRFKEAISEARLYDAKLRAGEVTAAELEKEKPLYGVPITVKESCSVEGLSYTGGTLARKGMKASEDGAAVEILKNAGAIPVCVTNTPELCSSFQTTNFLFGTTLNPYDRTKTSGGSSGGEGALIAAGASILGLGSDFLGSIKVPSLFNGIFGHKPSPGVVSVKGHLPMSPDPIFPKFIAIGPMARYAEDLHLAMKVLSSKCEKPLRLDDPVDLRKLRVFYMENFDSVFGVWDTTKDIRQTIKDGVGHLKKNGATVKELSQDWINSLFCIMMTLFGNVSLPNLLMDPEHPEKKKNPILEFIKAIFGRSQHTLSLIIMELVQCSNKYISPSTVKYYANVREELHQKFNDLLRDDGVLICPTYPQPAPFPELVVFQCDYGMYGGVANLLHLPSTHVPMGLNAVGLPVGFQVIAGLYQDRLCLAVAKELEKAFGGWTPPSK